MKVFYTPGGCGFTPGYWLREMPFWVILEAWRTKEDTWEQIRSRIWGLGSINNTKGDPMLEITVLQLLSNTLSTSPEFSSPNHIPKKKMLPMIGE